MQRPLLVLAVVMSLALVACSSGGSAGRDTAAGPAAGGGGSKPGAAGSAATGAQGTPGTAVAASTPTPIATFSRPSGPTPPPGYYDLLYDVVNVSVPEDESWGGADCAPPRAGSHCTILFRGIAYLAKDDRGTVLIQIIEDDRPVPKTIFSMPARKGRNTVYQWVPYAVPAGVRSVVTKAVLQNAHGVPLAESPPQRFYIS
jgi:hypothetical protein